MPCADDRAAVLRELRDLDHTLVTVRELTRVANTRVRELITWMEGDGRLRDFPGATTPCPATQAMARMDELLTTSGFRTRYAVARLLRDEEMSMDAIGEVFGVSRQRISMILQAPEQPEEAESDA